MRAPENDLESVVWAVTYSEILNPLKILKKSTHSNSCTWETCLSTCLSQLAVRKLSIAHSLEESDRRRKLPWHVGNKARCGTTQLLVACMLLYRCFCPVYGNLLLLFWTYCINCWLFNNVSLPAAPLTGLWVCDLLFIYIEPKLTPPRKSEILKDTETKLGTVNNSSMTPSSQNW